MNTILSYSGLVALVILAIMGIYAAMPDDQQLGAAIDCGDTTCFTKLGALTSFQNDGTSILNGLVTITGNQTISGNLAVSTTSVAADLNVGATNATSTNAFGRACFQFVVNNGGTLSTVYYTPSITGGGAGGWSTSTVSCF